MATVTNKGGRPRERELSPLGARIQARMRRLDMNVDDLAKTSGVKGRTLYHILDGHTAEPKPSTLAKLAAALGTTRERLSAGLF
jgi:transcriptional regulator with XRE-family HTH domain